MNINLNDFVRELYKKTQTQDFLLENVFSMYLEKQKSTKALGTYKHDLNHLNYLLRYFKANNVNFTSQINNNTIYNYINFEKSKGLSNTTINKNIILIKAVFNYLVKIELLESNPITTDKLKETEPKIEIISDDNIIRIIEYIKTLSNRSQLIVRLLLETGIRRNEIIHIKNSNINYEDNYIYLDFTKNKKPGYIYISDSIINLIKTENNNNPGIYLFSDDGINPLSVNAIQSLIYRIKKVLNISKLSAHLFRHTFATKILQNTHDLETVRLLLRHETYEITKRYLHIEQKKLKDSSLKNNPLASLFTE